MVGITQPLHPWMEADVRHNFAKLRTAPFCETARQSLHVILNHEPPASLDRAIQIRL
jgi:hypothetical protein